MGCVQSLDRAMTARSLLGPRVLLRAQSHDYENGNGEMEMEIELGDTWDFKVIEVDPPYVLLECSPEIRRSRNIAFILINVAAKQAVLFRDRKDIKVDISLPYCCCTPCAHVRTPMSVLYSSSEDIWQVEFV